MFLKNLTAATASLRIAALAAYAEAHGFKIEAPFSEKKRFDRQTMSYYKVMDITSSVDFEVLGEYDYRTHEFINREGAQYSEEEIAFVETHKVCDFCGHAIHNRSFVIRLADGSLKVIGSGCYNKCFIKHYLSDFISHTCRCDEDICRTDGMYFFNNLVAFVNDFDFVVANSTEAEYSGFVEKSQSFANLFFANLFFANAVNCRNASEEELAEVFKKIEAAPSSDYIDKIKAIAEDARESDGRIHRTAVAFMLGYLFNARENSFYENCEDASLEEGASLKCAVTLVFARVKLSDFGSSIKYVFQTEDNKLVIWYSSSDAYIESVGQQFNLSCKRPMLATERGHKVIRVKRASLK